MKTYRPGRLQVHARALKFPHDPWFVSPPFRRCAHPTLSHKNCCTSPKSVVFELSRPVPAPHFGCRLFSAKFFNLTYAAPALREVHCSTLHRRSCGIWFTYSYPWLSSIILSGEWHPWSLQTAVTVLVHITRMFDFLHPLHRWYACCISSVAGAHIFRFSLFTMHAILVQ